MTLAKEVLEHIKQKEIQEAMASIKPCPFCGSNNIKIDNDAGCYFVYCDDCVCQTTYYREEENAIEAWNRRAKDEPEN